MGVPFVDLKAQYHSIKAEIDAALIGTMESCAFTLGPEVAQLEKDFAVYAGNTYAAGVNNGTSALHLALLAAGIGPGDESMDFIYIEDLARANVLGLKSDATDEVFHIASGVETSLNELAATTMKVMGASADMVPEYGPERKVNAVSRRLSSTEKAERLLGFKAEVSLEESVRRFVAWWEANKDRFN